MRGNGWTDEFQWCADKSDDASSAALTNCNAERRQKIDAETGALETASTSRSTSSLSSASNDLARNISVSSYSDMLANDDIVIEENTTTATATTLSSGVVEATNGRRRNSNGSSSISNSGTSSSRAGATLRGLADDELPQPDTVRRAKDMFEALAQKLKAEEEQTWSSWTLPRRKDGGARSASIGRSQSMIMLTGRAWCNGGHMVANHHRNGGACSAAINGTRAVMQLGRSNTMPPAKRRFQRSCSDLDKFFRKHGLVTSNVESSNSSDNDEDMDDDDESDDADDEWSRKDTGSPVSTEVMRKIREHGLSVTFFGGQGFVEEDASSSDDDDYDDDYNNNAADIRHNQLDHHHHNGHNFHQQQQQQQDGDDDDTSDSGIGGGNNYLYDLYRSGQGTPSPSSTGRRVPKIVSFLPKVVANGLTSGSSANSTNTTNDENSSWVLTMDELKSTFNGHHHEEAAGGTSAGSGSSMASSHNGGGPRWMPPSNRVHGRWQRNPYWQGSYYVIYDFTNTNNNNYNEDDDELNEAENDINNELQSNEQTNGEIALEY